MAEIKLNYCVHHSGEAAAGINAYSNTVTVLIEGDPGGEPGEFHEALRGFLADWFDGARIHLGEWTELAGPDPELCQSAACSRGLHNECPDVEAICCDCSCHVR